MKKFFLLIMVSFLIAGCTPSQPTPRAEDNTGSGSSSSSSSSGGSVTNGTDDEPLDNTVNLTINMGNFSFTPGTIEAKAGDTIKINLLSNNGTHDFVIDQLGVQSKVLTPGQSEVIEFTIPADASKGTTYEFYCSIMDHKQRGMVGQINIV